MALRARVGVLPLIVVLGGCSPETEPSPEEIPNCAAHEIDRFKELLIVEPSIVGGPDSKNATFGILSFAYVVDAISGGDPEGLMADWFASYESPQTVNQYSIPARTRVLPNVLCPWLQLRPENNCDAGCTSCQEEVLDMTKAPFRLLAVSNRIDLFKQHPLPGAGEGRLVFGLTEGAGDLPESPGTDLSMIFEFDLPVDETRTRAYWAQRWHALGEHLEFDAAYHDALLSLVEEFAQPQNLSQVRTNERVFDWDWNMREFTLANGLLQPHSVENTPDQSLNGSADLADWVKANEAAIRDETHQMTGSFVGGHHPAALKWYVPGIPEDLRHAFASQTCGGCHQTERTSIDINFLVSPHRSGIDSVAPFLNDPLAPEDELGRRTVRLGATLCE